MLIVSEAQHQTDFLKWSWDQGLKASPGWLIVSGQVSGKAYPGVRATKSYPGFYTMSCIHAKQTIHFLSFPGRTTIRDFLNFCVSSILDSGSRTQDPGESPGSRVLDPRSSIKGLGSWIQHLRDTNESTKFKIYPGIRENFASWTGYHQPARFPSLFR